MKGNPQFVRVLFALRIPVPENFNTDEPNRAGDPVTVSVQRFEILEPDGLQVHFHAKENLFEKPEIDLVFANQSSQL